MCICLSNLRAWHRADVRCEKAIYKMQRIREMELKVNASRSISKS